ncbi:unnamed protein product [Dovyalis caffra]|uniref:Uncharacterized protein n=1 Tax=Dovyalis caffra TaxID=77055 RepID=A0AAV1SM13_9ROSI|nr:unnamed protein product [Dovyalis caffra]
MVTLKVDSVPQLQKPTETNSSLPVLEGSFSYSSVGTSRSMRKREAGKQALPRRKEWL